MVSYVFTHSVPIKPAWSKAAQLGIPFFFLLIGRVVPLCIYEGRKEDEKVRYEPATARSVRWHSNRCAIATEPQAL